ncbi:MAG: CAP domain-containing protein [Croceibacterium sp.]
MWTGRKLAALLAPLIAVGAASGAIAGQGEGPGNRFAQALPAEHNPARDQVGVPHLSWSNKLAREAQVWAERLAHDGRMYHSTNQQSDNAGEDLWMGQVAY